LLTQAAVLARKLKLPLVLHVAADDESLQAVLEILADVNEGPSPPLADLPTGTVVVLHDAVTACGSNLSQMEAAVAAGMWCSVSASGLTTVADGGDADALLAARACVATVPLKRLLLCTDAPWHTPQSISDHHLREQKNEPAYAPHVVAAIAMARGVPTADLLAGELEAFTAQLKANALRAFGLELFSAEAQAAAEAEAALATSGTETKSSGSTTCGGGVGGDGMGVTIEEGAGDDARCAFSDRNLHSRIPLDPTHVRLKRTCV
jgi:Tat protein secretion system quality control protein TatD with DNase activity